ncbi:hypothetical protein OROHE_006865 [Orobanche hederae]
MGIVDMVEMMGPTKLGMVQLVEILRALQIAMLVLVAETCQEMVVTTCQAAMGMLVAMQASANVPHGGQVGYGGYGGGCSNQFVLVVVLVVAPQVHAELANEQEPALSQQEPEHLHHVVHHPTTLAVGAKAVCKVDYDRRKRIAPNHTCTHMLNFALRCKPVEPKQLKEIEAIVNKQIEDQLNVFGKEVALSDAHRINGLRAVFGENYPDLFRVVAIGRKVQDLLADPENQEWLSISTEVCGGSAEDHCCYN